MDVKIEDFINNFKKYETKALMVVAKSTGIPEKLGRQELIERLARKNYEIYLHQYAKPSSTVIKSLPTRSLAKQAVVPLAASKLVSKPTPVLKQHPPKKDLDEVFVFKVIDPDEPMDVDEESCENELEALGITVPVLPLLL